MANMSISVNPLLHLAKQGVMPDLNLVDLEMDLTSNLILKSTLPLDQVLQQWMSMIIVTPTDILMPRLLVMPRRDMVTLTAKEITDTIMGLLEVMIMDIRMVVVGTRMGR